MNKNKLIEYVEKLKKENLIVEENIAEELKEEVIQNVTYDSRKVVKDTLFLCKGSNFKLEYLNNALEQGAIAYISEEKYKIDNKPYIIVKNIRRVIAILCSLYNNNPEKEKCRVEFSSRSPE